MKTFQSFPKMWWYISNNLNRWLFLEYFPISILLSLGRAFFLPQHRPWLLPCIFWETFINLIKSGTYPRTFFESPGPKLSDAESRSVIGGEVGLICAILSKNGRQSPKLKVRSDRRKVERNPECPRTFCETSGPKSDDAESRSIMPMEAKLS